MKNDLETWIEILTSLYRSQVRQAASKEGIQSVHVEILQYLSICNHYSNTAQAMSEYLGQTKGSISQSLKLLEKERLIERKPCEQDKRVAKLYLTEKSIACLERISETAMPHLTDSTDACKRLKGILMEWQISQSRKGFGQCRSCRYNHTLEDGGFQCGLTLEPLKATDVKLICREHEFSTH